MAWIEKKLAEHGVKKIIPNDATLVAQYRRASEQAAVQAILTDAVETYRKKPNGVTVPANLRTLLEDALNTDPSRTWDSIVMEIAATAGSGPVARHYG